MLLRCGDLQRSFWGWSERDWIGLIDPSGENFRRTWPGQIGPNAREPHLTAMVCQMFLLNGSPLLEDLTSDLLLGLRGDPAMGEHRASTLYGVHRAVAALGHADPPPPLEHGPGLAAIEGTAPGWAEWAERWYATSTLTPKVRASSVQGRPVADR